MNSILKECPVCNRSIFFLKYKGNFTNPQLINKDNFMFTRKKILRPDIFLCKNCGMAVSSAIISDLQNIYSNLDEADREKRTTEYIKTFEYIYENIIKSFFEGIQGLSALDIGCFCGEFLSVLKNNDWNICGIEPSNWAVDYAKKKLGVNIFNGFIDEDLDVLKKLPPQKFNLITAFDVVEHLQKPELIFKIADSLLENNGYLICSLPNYNSLQRWLFGKYYNLFLIEHLWYFSPETFKKFALKNDYDIVLIKDFIACHSLNSIIKRILQFINIDYKTNNFMDNILLKIKRGDMLIVLKKNNFKFQFFN